MQCGLVVGTVIKVGYPPPTHRMVQIVPGKELPYPSFSGLSGTYSVTLEAARNDDKPMPVAGASVFDWGKPETIVDKADGTYALPFRWGPEPAIGASSATIDLAAQYNPKDNGINRQRAAHGRLIRRFGSAQTKTAYLVNLNEAGYPEVDDIPDLAPYFQAFWKAVWDITTNSLLPAWDGDRLNYSQMLCAAVDVRVSEGGVSS